MAYRAISIIKRCGTRNAYPAYDHADIKADSSHWHIGKSSVEDTLTDGILGVIAEHVEGQEQPAALHISLLTYTEARAAILPLSWYEVHK